MKNDDEMLIVEDSLRRRLIVRFVLTIYIVGCLTAFGYVFALIIAILFSPFDDTPDEFVNAKGSAAKRQLGQSWPKSVLVSDVLSVDYKSHGSRDSSATWIRITLAERAASVWADHVHAREAAWARKLAKIEYSPEGVIRTIPGPIPLRQQTGTTPEWWSPLEGTYRATEVMVWYTNGESGTARATYSIFDASKKCLWIYEYTCQHDKMWSRGEIPDGIHLVLEGLHADKGVQNRGQK